MKYVMLFVLLLGTLVLFNGTAQASVLEDIVKFVGDHPAKTGIYYDIVDQEGKAYVGTVIQSDFLYKNVDLDLGVAAPEVDMINLNLHNYQTVLGGLSYNIPVGTKYALSVGANAGFDRVENLKDIGEFKYGGTISIKW